MWMRPTVLLLSLHALVASVSGSPADAPAPDVAESEQQARIQQFQAVNNLSTLAVGDTCGPVTGANVLGDCRNRDTTCCLGFYTRGFCPHDPNNVLCCTVLQRCNDNSGWCNDLNHVSCSVPYVAGKCPGPSNVQCCRGSVGESVCTPGGPG